MDNKQVAKERFENNELLLLWLCQLENNANTYSVSEIPHNDAILRDMLLDDRATLRYTISLPRLRAILQRALSSTLQQRHHVIARCPCIVKHADLHK